MLLVHFPAGIGQHISEKWKLSRILIENNGLWEWYGPQLPVVEQQQRRYRRYWFLYGGCMCITNMDEREIFQTIREKHGSALLIRPSYFPSVFSQASEKTKEL